MYISLYFLRPVATVTDKLLCDSPYHGVRIAIIARFQSIPLIVYAQIECKAFFATADVCEGSLSITNNFGVLLLCFTVMSKSVGN